MHSDEPWTMPEVEELIERRIANKFQALESRISELARLQSAQRDPKTKSLAIVVFSGDLDKLMAAFTMATGAASMGLSVSMFFTFWGLVALRQRAVFKGKNLIEKILTAMLPSNPARVGISRMNCLGLGPLFFRRVMRRRHVTCLEELVTVAQQLNVRMIACQASMELMGISKGELIDGLDSGGVASFLDTALDSELTLFI
jgi:peroxiredoxin family protein